MWALGKLLPPRWPRAPAWPGAQSVLGSLGSSAVNQGRTSLGGRSTHSSHFPCFRLPDHQGEFPGASPPFPRLHVGGHAHPPPPGSSPPAQGHTEHPCRLYLCPAGNDALRNLGPHLWHKIMIFFSLLFIQGNRKLGRGTHSLCSEEQIGPKVTWATRTSVPSSAQLGQVGPPGVLDGRQQVIIETASAVTQPSLPSTQPAECRFRIRSLGRPVKLQV